ncbi:hypothetical protein GCM10008107_16530 [Psychrosphaera saromensis]|uniref:DUF4145 domain-containing protein n=1 Tax=Psychrosphaera saromensis TaxID=716813 RepID=A0A2S7UTS1_9GAMM|nr:DUF4145 domain-containing protein [Psychrosphaera saromensis]PQJ53135.1 hypothetical protein BTO11_05300 [Psychrosphaera saromensis]GHB67768.1 hypothetical protein GCM10008107_16530 [Psychrosphaera saromensis]GLQ15109.1 hypothetical protein GCM10007917_25640 [Psychrosphaera saromensis]
MTKLNDVEYVKEYDEDIGLQYEEAKSSYVDAPIQTLVSLRSIIYDICTQLNDEYGLAGGNDLAQLINNLKSEAVFNNDVIELLHKIRKAGNAAAHKHDYNLTIAEYKEISSDTVQQFCQLISGLNAALRNDFSEYVFEASVAPLLEKLSYNVFFNDDPESKFKLGTALIEQVITLWSDLESTGGFLYDEKRKIQKGTELIKSAANQRHYDAMFEYGMMLVKGSFVEKDLNEAKKYLHTAACFEHTDAKAYYGCFAIEEQWKDDIDDGIEFLKEAAEELNPLALTQLSALYKSGEYVEIDIHKSDELLAKAVEQDYPLALCQLGVNKLHKNEVDLAIELLIRSKVYGFHHASLVLARVYSHFEDKHQESIIQYTNYIDSLNYDDSNYLDVHFELAVYKFTVKAETVESLAEYLSSLLKIYQNELCTAELKQRIETITPPAVKKYHHLLINHKQKNKDDMSLLLQFLPNGKPRESSSDIVSVMEKVVTDNTLLPNLIYGVNSTNEEAKKLTNVNELKEQVSNKKIKDKAKARKLNKQKRKQKR